MAISERVSGIYDNSVCFSNYQKSILFLFSILFSCVFSVLHFYFSLLRKTRKIFLKIFSRFPTFRSDFSKKQKIMHRKLPFIRKISHFSKCHHAPKRIKTKFICPHLSDERKFSASAMFLIQLSHSVNKKAVTFFSITAFSIFLLIFIRTKSS